jgi:septum formation protein
MLAERKARSVAGRQQPGRRWILGADTLVVLGRGDERRILGKPRDALEARRMLESLSESRHRVITGVCVLRLPDRHVQSAAQTTWVSMRRILPQEIEAYVASEEWRDKAGGYAIQERADRFVTRLEEGGFDNVVGLPVGLTLELLRRSGAAV